MGLGLGFTCGLMRGDFVDMSPLEGLRLRPDVGVLGLTWRGLGTGTGLGLGVGQRLGLDSS